MNTDITRIQAEMLLKTEDTMYEGLGLDGRPEQGASPLPYLTLRELSEHIVRSNQAIKLFAPARSAESALDACRPQRSEDGTHQGDAQQNLPMFHANVSRNALYVLVTRKESLKNETNRQAGSIEA